jgi:hypothetical protein
MSGCLVGIPVMDAPTITPMLILVSARSYQRLRRRKGDWSECQVYPCVSHRVKLVLHRIWRWHDWRQQTLLPDGEDSLPNMKYTWTDHDSKYSIMLVKKPYFQMVRILYRI